MSYMLSIRNSFLLLSFLQSRICVNTSCASRFKVAFGEHKVYTTTKHCPRNTWSIINVQRKTAKARPRRPKETGFPVVAALEEVAAGDELLVEEEDNVTDCAELDADDCSLEATLDNELNTEDAELEILAGIVLVVEAGVTLNVCWSTIPHERRWATYVLIDPVKVDAAEAEEVEEVLDVTSACTVNKSRIMINEEPYDLFGQW